MSEETKTAYAFKTAAMFIVHRWTHNITRLWLFIRFNEDSYNVNNRQIPCGEYTNRLNKNVGHLLLHKLKVIGMNTRVNWMPVLILGFLAFRGRVFSFKTFQVITRNIFSVHVLLCIVCTFNTCKFCKAIILACKGNNSQFKLHIKTSHLKETESSIYFTKQVFGTCTQTINNKTSIDWKMNFKKLPGM